MHIQQHYTKIISDDNKKPSSNSHVTYEASVAFGCACFEFAVHAEACLLSARSVVTNMLLCKTRMPISFPPRPPATRHRNGC